MKKKELEFGLAERILDELGIYKSQTNQEQLEVYLEAFELFVERNKKYEDLWRAYGWMDTLTHVRSKAMRLMVKFWREDSENEGEVLLDDAFDLINYTVFFIRNWRERNQWGRSHL